MHKTYLIFSLQGAWYAIDTSPVREILQLPALTPITAAPPYIIGMVNYRGQIVPVMDLGIRLGEAHGLFQIDDHVIILEQESRLLGIIVNAVQGVHQIPQDRLEVCAAFAASKNGGWQFVRYVTTLDTAVIMILDHELLLSTIEESRADVSQAGLTMPHITGQQYIESPLTRDGVASNPFEGIHLSFNHMSPHERKVMIERARNLTSSTEEQSITPQKPLAIVGLGGEYFGVELGHVSEFTDLQRMTPVPCCPEYIVGDMNLRGDILTVVDIRMILQMSVSEVLPTAEVVVITVSDSLIGILVDHIFDVLDFNAADLVAVPSPLKSINETYLKGAILHNDRFLIILDIQKILKSGILNVNDEI